MKPQTEYRYRKRIEELERENKKLSADRSLYRASVMDIFDAICALDQGNYFPSTVLEKLRRVLWRE